MKLAEMQEFLAGSPKRIHLIGVAGSGMSGIAGLLISLGHHVSGSDRVDSQETGRLVGMGLRFTMPHDADCVRDADLVIRSSAVKPGNAAFDEAERLGLPIVRRADALAALMGPKRGVIICGTHGKTTTSAMAAHVLRWAGIHPSHYVGAEIPILGSNACWDPQGDIFVAEGDESDGTLINYQPEFAVVLNIEPEHLDFYRELSAIDAVFGRLCDQTSGKIIFCADNPGAVRVCAARPGALSFGSTPGASFRLDQLETSDFRCRFGVVQEGTPLGTILLNIPGAHNAQNALAVVALATRLGIPFDTIREALLEFRGARRRFEIKYESARQIIVDDYGHHPTEIRATLATARTGPWKRTVVMFQPHRYSRTVAFRDDFAEAFRGADEVFVTGVYPAGEKPLPGVSGLTLVDAAREVGLTHVHHHDDLLTLHRPVAQILREGDLVLSLGAGNIHEAASRLVEDLRIRDAFSEIPGSGEIRLAEPLSRHTTMRIGGPARFWVEPSTVGGFSGCLKLCMEMGLPVFVIGRGSNLLIRDGGFRGVVFHLSGGEFDRCEFEGCRVTVGVGVKLKQLAAKARSHLVGGFEWMDGIPGNVGGALRMNAGAMGVEMFNQVVELTCCHSDGRIETLTPSRLDVRYRNVPRLSEIFAVGAVLEGKRSTVGQIQSLMDAGEWKRKSSQPVASSAGCIFKNPESMPAGKLVEELGLKNFTVGKARVSEVHGNFIVNDGGATAEEVLTLIDEIKAAAWREREIELETEVQIVGEDE